MSLVSLPADLPDLHFVKELPSAALWLTSDPDPQPHPIWVTTELIEVVWPGLMWNLTPTDPVPQEAFH